MTDIDFDGSALRLAGAALGLAVAEIPTTSPLALGSVTENDVIAAANNFNLWATYAGLSARAQLTAIVEAVTSAATALELAEAQLAANAGTTP